MMTADALLRLRAGLRGALVLALAALAPPDPFPPLAAAPPPRAARQEPRPVLSGADAEAATVIRERLTAAPRGESPVCCGERLSALDDLRRFYERRRFKPAWTGDGVPQPIVEDMILLLGGIEKDGLRGDTYHLPPIRSAFEAAQADGPGLPGDAVLRLTDLELLLSDSCLLLAGHLASGAIEPDMIEAEWFIQKSRPDAAAVLQQALNVGDPARALAALRPARPEYGALREALEEYGNLARRGGWTAVAPGPTLRPGESGPRVRALRERLAASGDGAGPPSDGSPDDLYDGAVREAVRLYQSRHGLWVDGVAGPETLASLAVPVEARMSCLKANLERWRWLPRSFGTRYLMVNAAAYRLDMIEDGAPALEMPVVVGTAATRTPVFDELMTEIELNPAWNVPPSIAGTEILDSARADPEYLARWGYKLYAGWGATAGEVDPATVDWAAQAAETFPYRVIQKPGPLNSLGRLAFLFPNPWAVYLHDTPQRELFDRPQRNFSHGCIRISRPLDLAARLLADDSAWTREALEAAIATGANQVVSLLRPIPVYIVYLTAWRDKAGVVNFREDIYGRDTLVVRALEGDMLPAARPVPGR